MERHRHLRTGRGLEGHHVTQNLMLPVMRGDGDPQSSSRQSWNQDLGALDWLLMVPTACSGLAVGTFFFFFNFLGSTLSEILFVKWPRDEVN